MVCAVDRHAHVVEQAAGHDHHLGVAGAHGVVRHHHWLDPAPREQAEEPQGDVADDLHVDPGVVGHPQPLGLHLGHVPPGPHLRVGVDAVEQRLEPAVTAARSSHLRARDRLAGRPAEFTGTRGDLLADRLAVRSRHPGPTLLCAVVGSEGPREPRCSDTGLTVPECSCHRCLEAMLRELQPGLLTGEFQVSRVTGQLGDEPGTQEHRGAA